jgi:hypothetical protein
MSWKREREGLIAQTLAVVQSAAGWRDQGAAPEATARLPPEAEAVSPPVSAADSRAVAAVAPSVIANASRTVTPKVAPPGFEPPSIAPSSPAASSPIAQRPIAPSDTASEIRARIASFRAHQERFNREREEYFAATLARVRAAIKDTPPPRTRR